LIGLKDFPKGDPKPVDQPTLTPTTADPFNPIDHPAESRFRDIRRQRNPELMIQPVIEKRQGLVREVLQIRPRLRIFVLRQRRHKLPKAAPDRPDESSHQRLVLGAQRLQVGLTQMEERVLVQKLKEALLLLPFDMVRVEEETEVTFPVHKTALVIHRGVAQALLDPRPAIGKQHPQTAVIQTAIKVPADGAPVLSNPKSNQFKGLPLSLRGPGPAQLGRSQGISPGLEVNFRAVDHQKLKRPVFHRRPSALGLRQVLKPAPEGAFRRPVSQDPLRLPGSQAVRQMNRLTHRRFERRSRVLPIRFDLQLRGQRAEDRSVPVPHLGQPIANLAERGPKHTAIALVPVADAAAPAVFFFGLLLQGLEKRDEEVPHDLVTVALEPAQKAVEREIALWYLIGDGDLDFEVVHWATPPSVVVNIMEGCSPSFLPLSNAIT